METVAEATKEFNAEAKRVLAFDWKVVPHTNSHAYWGDFAREHNIRPQIEEMWEYHYIEICEQRPSRTLGRLGVPTMDMATMRIMSVPEQNRRRDIRNRLIDARDLHRAEVRRLEVELAAAVTARDSLEQPRACDGPGGPRVPHGHERDRPRVFLAPTPATLTYREAVEVVGLFIVGIVVLFLYLGTHVYRLLHLSRAAGSVQRNENSHGRDATASPIR